MDAAALKELIEAGMPGAEVEAVAVDATDYAFDVTVVWDGFDGCLVPERYHAVFAALGDLATDTVRELTIRALAPAQRPDGFAQ